MNLGRIMVILGLLGVAGLGYAGWQGWRGLADDQIQSHILAGLIPLLVSVLAQGWIVFYLVGTRQLLMAEAAARGRTVDPRLARFGAQTLLPIVFGLGAAVATFVMGASAFAGWTQVGWHSAAFLAAVAGQLWGAVAAWRALEAVEVSLGALEPESAR
jgi:hypothetical protein